MFTSPEDCANARYSLAGMLDYIPTRSVGEGRSILFRDSAAEERRCANRRENVRSPAFRSQNCIDYSHTRCCRRLIKPEAETFGFFYPNRDEKGGKERGMGKRKHRGCNFGSIDEPIVFYVVDSGISQNQEDDRPLFSSAAVVEGVR